MMKRTATGVVLVMALFFSFRSTAAQLLDLRPSATNAPRVVIVEDSQATDAYQPHPTRVVSMVERGLRNLTGHSSSRDAWLSLVSTQDVVGLKVFSSPGPTSGTRPAVVIAVAQSLIAAGLPPQHIVIWDKLESDLRAAGFFEIATSLGVRVVASASAGWDATNAYDNPLIGKLVYGDNEFEQKGEGVGRKSFVSKLVSQELTRIINIAPLLNHNEAGVCGHLYSLVLGSVDNTIRFEGEPGRLSQAVPEIYALPAIGDRVVLNITDALLGQYEGGSRGLLHYSTVLNQLRFSRDAVALDVLSVRELERQRRLAKAQMFRANLELYRNATLLELGQSDLSKLEIETLR